MVGRALSQDTAHGASRAKRRCAARALPLSSDSGGELKHVRYQRIVVEGDPVCAARQLRHRGHQERGGGLYQFGQHAGRGHPFLRGLRQPALLFLGLKQAEKPPTAEHPLGYGKVTYFWSFVVALLLFSFGGLFSIYEGWHKLHDPVPLNKVWVALLVLGVAIVLETGSLTGALSAKSARSAAAGLLASGSSTRAMPNSSWCSAKTSRRSRARHRVRIRLARLVDGRHPL